MSNLHEQLGPFLDGELTPEEAAAFEQHLASCAQCQRDLVDFGALDALAAPRTRRKPLTRFAPLLLAAAVLIGVFTWLLTQRTDGPTTEPPRLALAATRSLEARLTWSPADTYRQTDAVRGAAPKPEAISAAVLAELERAHDTRALATAYLLSGNAARAKELFVSLPRTANAESDLAAVALLQNDAEAALAHTQNALELSASHPQARWNRALALERLGLVLLAAQTFHALEREAVPGWSTEAGERAQQLDRAWAESQSRSQRALDAAAAMVLQGQPMSDELVRAMPSFARMNFRYALLALPDEAAVRALAPTAATLDAVFGADTCTRALERLATLDPKVRARFAPRFRAVVVDYYLALRPTGLAPALPADAKGLGDATAFVAEVRKAHATDYLLFAAPLGRQLAAVWDDYVAAARSDPDPWFGMAVDLELARRAEDAADKERRLLELLEKARAHRAGLRMLQSLEQLTLLFTAQHRVLEATRFGLEALQVARSQGDASAAWRVLQSLGDAARFRNAAALSAAILEERTLRRPDDCDARAYLHESAASIEVASLHPAGARKELDAVPKCEQPLSVVGVGVLADLMRLAPQPGDAARLDEALAALRAAELSESDALLLSHFEGRALLDGTPQKGRALLERCIADAKKLRTHDAIPTKVVAYSEGLLRVADGEAGRWTEVLARVEPPAPARCALVVEVQDNRVVAALRTASGSDRGIAKRFELGPRRPEGLSLADLASLVTPLVREGAVGCEKLSVSAGYPLHGRAAWLPDDLAWSYAGGSSSPKAGTGPSLVVHDVATPPALELPRVGRWAEAARPGDIELSGDAATPERVLQAMKTASFIELHVHGQVNPVEADTAALLLAPDERGHFTLSAVDLTTKLEGSPVVVLGACRASSVAPFFHEPWSLPRAFLDAGAHAVVAAPVDLPDAEARVFFVRLVERLRSGQEPATALRDERVSFLKEKPGAAWVRSVLVFD